ncbi:hypothetical protein H632_c3147p0 [Helicosporidium sp. ATCC 50920]|nr:hypothetical protein H632_c3147p0 [Helicosporidium sp. ATCC 50920]|eukprot:KDD72594.1 hypothetical protein H632_c3147p0 [Helicosporidium sp. ATCC 50920]
MERAAEAVAALARATRPDLVAEVVREPTSGGFVLNAFGHEFTNAFNNLTNVVLRISPRGREHVPGVLLNAHYDSALGSPGASDAASCVGVALEVARTLVADSSRALDAPVVVLLNGGEETLMQAAQGFLESGAFSRNLGAFLNLESTGPWGPEILFQSTNDWTLGTYLRAVPHPRCSSVFQDFFDLNLFPADTDFRVLAKTRLGSLPGVDSAQLFDGVAYHTTQDDFGRIRRGTLQSSGENALAATRAFAARMLSQAERERASRAQADLFSSFSEVDGEDEEAEEAPASLRVSDQPEEGSVAFDVLGRWAVVYSHAAARVLHHVPLGVLVAAALMGSLLGSKAPRLLTLGSTATSLGSNAALALFSVVLAHVFPAALGALRALVSGAQGAS